jgi:hypothetical protein
MAGVETAAGTKLYVSAAQPATFDGVGYAALTWAKVGEVTDQGAHGRTYAEVTHKPIDNRGTRKFKGSFDDGTKQLSLAVDTTDPGQVILKQGLVSDNKYSFKVLYQGGDADYFQASVLSFPVSISGVDTMRTATVSLSLSTEKDGTGIVEVLAPVVP